MTRDPYIDKEALKSLTKKWKKALKVKGKTIPKKNKVSGSGSIFSILFICYLSALVIIKVSGVKLGFHAHFSGSVIIQLLLGCLLLSYSVMYFTPIIDQELVQTPVTSKLILRKTKWGYFSKLWLPILAYIVIAIGLAPPQTYLHISIIFGITSFLISFATGYIISLFIGAERLLVFTIILLLGFFILSFTDYYAGFLYFLIGGLEFIPLGWATSKFIAEPAFLFDWRCFLMILVSYFIIRHFFISIFSSFQICRKFQDSYSGDYIGDDLELDPDHAPPAPDWQLKIATQNKDYTDIRSHITTALDQSNSNRSSVSTIDQFFLKFYRFREITLLQIQEPYSAKKSLKLSLIALLIIISAVIYNHFSIKDLPIPFVLFPAIFLAANLCLRGHQALTSLGKCAGMQEVPFCGYYPISYKEIVRLHIKTILIMAPWKILLLSATLSAIRFGNAEPILFSFAHFVLITVTYFCTSYLCILSYKQPLNIISKRIGRRLYRYFALISCAIILIASISFFVQFLVLDHHPKAIYYSCLALIILSFISGIIRWRSYRSMQLDIIERGFN